MYCRHCGELRVTRPRGLCVDCYARPRVRRRYRPRTTNRRYRLHNVRLAPEPTPALPGSLAKLAVLERRAALRLQLFHPDDADGNETSLPRCAGGSS